ncbi:MAG: helix-turn-helix transcriptional regulator [Lachnospiraceae bacterium]|nr:helix-turn-helix transcriptional regulator [Lachnospiraceae bacterium]
MAKKLGTLVKEARTAAGLSQTALAAKVDGLTAADIGKIERGEKIPSQAVIKSMAKALGVTQTSLLNAYDVAGKTASASSSKTSSSKTSSAKTSSSKTSSSKTSSAKTSSAKTSSAKTSSSSGKKTSSSSSSSSSSAVKLTATEKKLLTAYRKADSSTKKAVLNILEGNGSIADILTGLFSGKAQNAAAGSLGSLLEGALGKIKK